MSRRPIIGSREWVLLPQLGLPAVLAKVDTGARTSTLHASDILVEDEVVHFTGPDGATRCQAPLLEWRWVKDSGGHPSLRPIIRTTLRLGRWAWDDEVTLFDRHALRHRMLLGRRAVAGRFLVDPSIACLWPEPSESLGDGVQPQDALPAP